MQTTMPNKEFYTIADVAVLLNRSIQTIHTWRKKGKMPEGYKLVNNCLFWKREDIMTWINSKKGA
jgi:predicted DNA-binding transcriptional regulator AlpA